MRTTKASPNRRITPAYAGKRTTVLRESHSQWGSPPPMRGKGFDADRVGVRPGITPAYAGKSCACCVPCVCVWDHPRLCGEKEICDGRHRRENGSPPPMRGKVTHGERRKLRRRITPAYAGKSGFQCRHNVLHKDHPRLCGEK